MPRLTRLEWLERATKTHSVALGQPGPPELSKLLWEAELIAICRGTIPGALQATRAELSREITELLDRQGRAERQDRVAGHPDPGVGWGHPAAGAAFENPGGCRGGHGDPAAADRDSWAAKGRVDLSEAKFYGWQRRLRAIIEARPEKGETGSSSVAAGTSEAEEIRAGAVVAWVLANELGGIGCRGVPRDAGGLAFRSSLGWHAVVLSTPRERAHKRSACRRAAERRMLACVSATRNRRTTSGSPPVLRWAGSKASHASVLGGLLPAAMDRYVEPMIGGGALFFSTRPQVALVSDVNPELVNFYITLRDDPDSLIEELSKLRASRRSYYAMRSERPDERLKRAVRFAFLNRLCWNGLYRVNQKGDFNVPIGNRLPRKMWDFDRFRDAARALDGIEIRCDDVRDVMRTLRRGDFVFLDPPYSRGSSEALGFNRYSAEAFGSDDHVEVADLSERLADLGVMVMVTVSSESRLERLYPRDWGRRELHGKSLVGSNGDSRGAVVELVLTSYEVPGA